MVNKYNDCNFYTRSHGILQLMTVPLWFIETLHQFLLLILVNDVEIMKHFLFKNTALASLVCRDFRSLLIAFFLSPTGQFSHKKWVFKTPGS